jgi:kumamolisin
VHEETVWNESTKNEGATGGGVSNFFALPTYQANAKVPVSLNTKFKGRGVPDVAGSADPVTGFKVTVDGQTSPIGGTSGVAPLMAGFIALTNQKTGKSAGFINPGLYASPTGKCRDITKGNNITSATGTGYDAGTGWDACTGWGVLFDLS